MSPRVAVLGTGKMGSAIARRLFEAGNDVTVWNRTRERAEQLGVGHVAATPAEAIAEADFGAVTMAAAELLVAGESAVSTPR